MAQKILLKVPQVPQTRTMSCWYACVCMVNWYFEAGPRLGWPELYDANQGIHPSLVPELARREGLRRMTGAEHPYTGESLIRMLDRNGPLFAPGQYFGREHIVVVTGCEIHVSGNVQVYVNDPGVETDDFVDTLETLMNLEDFNEMVHGDLVYVKDLGALTRNEVPRL